MKSVLYLAWRYLVFNRWKTVVLVATITVIVFLPLALELVLDRSSEGLRARARATPLLLGAPGSPLELVLNSLYFEGQTPAPLKYASVVEVLDTGLAEAIPLHVRYRVSGQPVVGTSPDYFDFRGLRIAEGRRLALSGEAVLGASAARALDVEPGGKLVTSPETVFDVTGTYPLELTVVGVLAPTGTPDDRAVFVDVLTTWIIGGIGHGHEGLQDPKASRSVLKRDGQNIVANASIVQFRTITAENLADFHFHGDTGEFPLSAVIALPIDAKSGVLLEGRFENPEASIRIVQPSETMDSLLGMVFTVRQYVLVAVALVGVAAFATTTMVFLLSMRLRRGEINTMTRMGADPGRVAAILGTEVLLVLAASLVLAGLLTGLATAWGEELFRWMVFSGNP